MSARDVAIVLYPNDGEQMDRLCKALVEEMHQAGDKHSAANGVHPATVSRALHSLIRPPKPEEPTGLGAVVLDSQGTGVVHIGDGVWTRNGGPRADWSLVDAVKVLSEGMTP